VQRTWWCAGCKRPLSQKTELGFPTVLSPVSPFANPSQCISHDKNQGLTELSCRLQVKNRVFTASNTSSSKGHMGCSTSQPQPQAPSVIRVNKPEAGPLSFKVAIVSLLFRSSSTWRCVLSCERSHVRFPVLTGLLAPCFLAGCDDWEYGRRKIQVIDKLVTCLTGLGSHSLFSRLEIASLFSSAVSCYGIPRTSSMTAWSPQ
jgi:hypothetical protein